MITPSLIHNKDFTRGVRGYKEEEVDQFLDLIAADIDALMRENAALKENIKSLKHKAESSRSSDKTLLSTLEAAKKLMADIGASAEKRADIVLKNAELDAERIKREAREAVESMTEEAYALSRRWELFSARFRNLLETELDRFDSFSAMKYDETLPARPAEMRVKKNISKPAFNTMAIINPEKTFKSPRQL